ncbi:hypothetical protein L202_05242 [Cryptococcus amylolentus CBS 6039]|uniref:Uncharacterized protein n=1 Tax=Cryptococcus amylolentus CBS 6039 TaxID=1295533 RepID=A0A1E3HJS2_9TREE|nr:hypothetical protein L202_05242 [Cryptococcus amylolentus CBS 6039]ODN76583.1 hypothetical protein L202_05242 [Cryptococcus amylolentus CBS 6039]
MGSSTTAALPSPHLSPGHAKTTPDLIDSNPPSMSPSDLIISSLATFTTSQDQLDREMMLKSFPGCGETHRVEDWYARGFKQTQDREGKPMMLCIPCSQQKTVPILIGLKKFRSGKHEKSPGHGTLLSVWQEQEGMRVLQDVEEQRKRLERDMGDQGFSGGTSRAANWKTSYEVELKSLAGIIHRHTIGETTLYHCAPCSLLNHAVTSSDLKSIGDLVAHSTRPDHLTACRLYLQQRAEVVGVGNLKRKQSQKRKVKELADDETAPGADAEPSMSVAHADPSNQSLNPSVSTDYSGVSPEAREDNHPTPKRPRLTLPLHSPPSTTRSATIAVLDAIQPQIDKSTSKRRVKQSMSIEDWYARGFTKTQNLEGETKFICTPCSQTNCPMTISNSYSHERSFSHGTSLRRWQHEEGERVSRDIRKERRRLEREIHDGGLQNWVKRDADWVRGYEVELDRLEGIIHRHTAEEATRYYHCAPCSTLSHSTLSSDLHSIKDLVSHLESPEHLALYPLYLQQRAEVVGVGLRTKTAKTKHNTVETPEVEIPSRGGEEPFLPAASVDVSEPSSLSSSLPVKQSTDSALEASLQQTPTTDQPAPTSLPATSPAIPTASSSVSLKTAQAPSTDDHIPLDEVLPPSSSRLSQIQTIQRLGANLERTWQALLADP